MHTILLYLYMVGLALGISLLFERKIEETMPISIFATIITEYLIGIVVRDLNVAYITTIMLAVIVVLIALLLSISRKKLVNSVKINLVTNGFVVFTLSFFWVYIISRGMVVREFDEYSHWATVVKNMTYFDRFGNYEFSTGNRMFPGYPPGVSLWQYFCCKLYGKYHEGTLYQAMDLMLISCILPVCSKFKNKQILKNCVVYGMLLFVPLISYKELYGSLYVDALLGFVMAYELFFVFVNDEKNSMFVYFAITVGLTVLCLIKASGAFLALIVAVILLAKKIMDKNERRKGLICTVVSIGAFLLIGKKSWSWYLATDGTRGAWNTSQVSLNSIVELLKGNGQDYQYITAKNFLHFLLETDLIGNRICLSYVELTLVVSVLVILIYLLMERNKKWILYIIGLIVGQVIYTIGMLVLYMYTFGETEAVALASIGRYLNTYFVAFYLFVIMVISTMEYKKKTVEYMMHIAMLCVVVWANWSRINDVTFNYKRFEAGFSYIYEKYGDLAESSSKLSYSDDSIGVVTLDEDAFENIAVYYYMTPIELKTVYDFGENGKNKGYSSRMWMNDILSLESMNYIYILSIDSDFINDYGDCFEGYPEKGMYQIDKKNKKLVKFE